MALRDHRYYINSLEKIIKNENASREAFEKIEAFIGLLEKWNPRINLIRYRDHAELWERHILDCARLLFLIPPKTTILTDFGSGGGFPGIILALLKPMTVHLIESDERKCAFLFEASHSITPSVQIHTARIEALAPWESDVLTARALAPLKKLIPLTEGFIQKTKICLFQKGENGVEEMEEAKKMLPMASQLDMRMVSLPEAPHSHIIYIQGGRS